MVFKPFEREAMKIDWQMRLAFGEVKEYEDDEETVTAVLVWLPIIGREDGHFLYLEHGSLEAACDDFLQGTMRVVTDSDEWNALLRANSASAERAFEECEREMNRRRSIPDPCPNGI